MTDTPIPILLFDQIEGKQLYSPTIPGIDLDRQLPISSWVTAHNQQDRLCATVMQRCGNTIHLRNILAAWSSTTERVRMPFSKVVLCFSPPEITKPLTKTLDATLERQCVRHAVLSIACIFENVRNVSILGIVSGKSTSNLNLTALAALLQQPCHDSACDMCGEIPLPRPIEIRSSVTHRAVLCEVCLLVLQNCRPDILVTRTPAGPTTSRCL